LSEFAHLSALVVGSGSIGRRHMQNLRALGIEKIAAVDPDSERLKPVIEELGVLPYNDLQMSLRLVPNVVLICTPPSLHAEQAMAAIKVGSHVFVEKPLANNMADIDELVSEAKKKQAIVHVGYNLRFIPGLVALQELITNRDLGKPLWGRFEFGQYLPDWRPWQDYRQSYTARRSLGGGIILDASHEIDLAMWLLGRAVDVCCMAGKTSNLQMDVEDTATILVRHESGAQSDIHVDCVQREYSRSLKIAFEQGAVTWSWPENIVRINEIDKAERLILPPKNYMANQMYVEELQSFLSAVVSRTQSSSMAEGREVMRVALSGLQSSAEKKWVSL
jgi:predicted dehydrogenase